MNKLFWIGYGLMWLSVSIAVSIGIYYTHSIKCLFFLIIPALMHFHVDEDKEDEE